MPVCLCKGDENAEEEEEEEEEEGCIIVVCIGKQMYLMRLSSSRQALRISNMISCA